MLSWVEQGKSFITSEPGQIVHWVSILSLYLLSKTIID